MNHFNIFIQNAPYEKNLYVPVQYRKFYHFFKISDKTDCEIMSKNSEYGLEKILDK